MQFGRAIQSATQTAIYASVRAQPHFAESGSSTIQATEGRIRARGCKGRAGTPDCVLRRRFTGLLAQVHGTFGAGVVFGDRTAPTQAIESCFAEQVPTIFPHLRQIFNHSSTSQIGRPRKQRSTPPFVPDPISRPGVFHDSSHRKAIVCPTGSG